MIVASTAIVVLFFIVLFILLNSHIDALNRQVELMDKKMGLIEKQATIHFDTISKNLSNLGTGIDKNSKSLQNASLLLGMLGDEIERVGRESAQRVLELRSEFNYTAIIDAALDGVVLIMNKESKGAIGSGFLMGSGDIVLTAKHVIDKVDGRDIVVKRRDGSEYPASKEYEDEDTDVAILRIEHVSENTTALEFGDSDALTSGSKVFALGAPEGFSFSATEGIVSAAREVHEIRDEIGVSIDLDDDIVVVQTDAAITHGNSGGPLIDRRGQVVGLNSFGISKNKKGVYQDVEGLNFAISSKDVLMTYEKYLDSIQKL